MRQAEKRALLRFLYRLEFDGVTPFKDVLVRAARIVLLKDAIAAEAYAEPNAESLWSYLFQTQEEDERRGISRTFTVVDSVAMTFRWCSPMAGGPAGRRVARLRHRPAMLGLIDTLTNREFEALARVV